MPSAARFTNPAVCSHEGLRREDVKIYLQCVRSGPGFRKVGRPRLCCTLLWWRTSSWSFVHSFFLCLAVFPDRIDESSQHCHSILHALLRRFSVSHLLLSQDKADSLYSKQCIVSTSAYPSIKGSYQVPSRILVADRSSDKGVKYSVPSCTKIRRHNRTNLHRWSSRVACRSLEDLLLSGYMADVCIKVPCRG